jgi:GTP-binding protein
MKHNLFRGATFVTSAAEPRRMPADTGAEIAFAGRSNAGKSSALNAICDQSGLARTSKTPGRTQLLNVFALDDDRRLVDLPGYGYAKVPEAIRERWRAAIDRYLRERAAGHGEPMGRDDS